LKARGAPTAPRGQEVPIVRGVVPPCKSLVRASVTLALAAAFALPAGATIYQYENPTAGTIPQSSAADDNLPNSCVSNGLERTFVVPDSFTVATASVGVNITHGRRGDINVVLESPSGLRHTIFTAVGGDDNDNFDILISASAEVSGTDDGDNDPVGLPHYHRALVDPSDNNLPAFTGQASSGTWRVFVCDDNTSGGGGGFVGTLNRARLVLTAAGDLPNVCASTVTYDWGSFGTGFQNFANATVNDILITETDTDDVFDNGVESGGTAFGACGSQTGGGTPCSTYPAGGEDGFYIRRMIIPNNEAGGMIATFSFNPPVRDLQFSHLDIDQQTAAGWEDQVRIQALDVAGSQANVLQCGASGTTRRCLPHDASPEDPGEMDQFGDIFGGDLPNKGSNDPGGNVNYHIAGPVATLTVEYFPGDEPGSFASQFVGLGDFTMCAYDFGDAPDSYSTNLSGGARHVLGNRLVHLGINPPDGEADGQPNTPATLDGADEDGVASFPGANLAPGDTYTVPVRVTNVSGAAATLCGWIDFDLDGPPGDGTFESDEGACVAVPATDVGNAACTSLGSGGFDCDVTFTVPADFVYVSDEPTYARFRVSNHTLTEASMNGRVDSGEVEDYRLDAGTLPVTLAYFSAEPDGHLTWATATETANAGFWILGAAADGGWRTLHTEPSAVLNSGVPQDYEAWIELPEDVVELALVDVDVRGKTRQHGPFAVGEAYGERPELRRIDWAAIKDGLGIAGPLERVAEARRVASELRDGVGPRKVSLPDRRPQANGTGDGEARLLVAGAGIHRVTHEELLAAGVDFAGVRADSIALIDAGRPVERVIGGGPDFGPGSWIEFLFEPQLTLESPVDVVELRVAPQSARQPRALASSLAGSASPTVYGETLVAAPDRRYNFSSPLADPWFDAEVFAWGGPASLTRSFDLPDLASGPVELTLNLWGTIDWPGGGLDHHVVVSLNGSQLVSDRFDGLTAWSRTFDVGDLVAESGNQLVIDLPRDTGFSFDMVTLEGFEVRHPRRTLAREGRWNGVVAGRGSFAVDGLDAGAPAVVWMVTDKGTWRSEAEGPSVAIRMPGHPTWVATQDALLQPGIEPGIPEPASLSKASYLVITHPAFADHLDGLLALQHQRGLRTQVVTTEAIYARYSDHAADPSALRQYVADSAKGGKVRRLGYVVLVGTASYDPWDHLGHGSISFVPTFYRAIAPPVVNHAPTDELIADLDGDGLADVPIGRLPVRTVGELAVIVDKLVAWQGRPDHGSALLAAGRSDGGRTLAELNEGLAGVLAPWGAATAGVDDLGVPAVRQAVLEAFGPTGPSLVSFVGHTSYGLWDFSGVLRWQDVVGFTNHGRPAFVTQWGCWTSYFVSPEVETLSDHLLVTPGVGAVGTIGAATLTRSESHERLGELFFAAVAGGSPTVGDALLAAKRHLAAEGSSDDAVLGMVLLGDPAMPLAP
jgi:hypothetical protein